MAWAILDPREQFPSVLQVSLRRLCVRLLSTGIGTNRE